MKRIYETCVAIGGLLFLIATVPGCQNAQHDDHGHEAGHEHGADHSESYARGVHGGRLLEQGTFGVEVQIFEQGVPPQYRVFAYDNGVAIPAKDYSVRITLKRLGGVSEEYSFSPAENFQVSSQLVGEPHSFSVEVSVQYNQKTYSWQYDSFEGRTILSDRVAQISGIKTERSSPQTIARYVRVRGKIMPSEDRIAHIIPRFSGVVQEGRKHIGDSVNKNEVVATIESNQSLQPFAVRSQIDGMVINGHVVVGEFIPENQWIYIVADISEVWADFFIPLRERVTVSVDQPVLISTVNGGESLQAAISYVAPYADEKTQSRLVRVVLNNPEKQFLPGMFVLGDLLVDKKKAAVAVKKTAIQNFRDWQVVFVKVGDVYEFRPVELGETDGEWVEIRSGLPVGAEYVSENSFLIKADILKSGATHDH